MPCPRRRSGNRERVATAANRDLGGRQFTAENKVKVVGTATVSGRAAVAVMSFDVTGAGSVDESFNGNGQALIQLGSSSSQGRAVPDVRGSSGGRGCPP